MNFIKALINFILIIQYRFHDDLILIYLQHVLYRLNIYKKIFRQSRLIVHEIEENNFNFFKFHVITHYVDFIKKYEAANEYNTFHDETRHKYMIKKFYCKINKREIFQTQFIEHNKKRIKILALKNKMRSTKKNSQTKKIEFTHTRVNKDSLNIKLVNIAINRRQHENFSRSSIH